MNDSITYNLEPICNQTMPVYDVLISAIQELIDILAVFAIISLLLYL